MITALVCPAAGSLAPERAACFAEARGAPSGPWGPTLPLRSPPQVEPSLPLPQAAAKLQEAERVLHEQDVVLKAVTRERDQALQALRTHGPRPEEAQVRPWGHVGASPSQP